MRTFWIISTNCDCCSDTIALSHNPSRNMIGPRCRGCQKVLGCMQWDLKEKVRALTELDAVNDYNKRKKMRV